MEVADFLDSLKDYVRKDCESGLKDKGRNTELVTGPRLFYRFVGHNEDGNENRVYGPWWFSKEVYQQFVQRSKNLKVSLTEYSKVRLALPDAWNSKEHLYEMHIPEGASLYALKGTGRGQQITGKREPYVVDKESKEQIKNNVFFIGGDEQYFFKMEDIQKFTVVKNISAF